MTEGEVKKLLEGLGYPVAYHHFDASPGVTPYIVWYIDDYEEFYADDLLYYCAGNLTIDLYADEAVSEAEGKIEAIINASAEKPYTKSRGWSEDEKLYITTYKMEV